jgi:hypothetical protein
VRVKLRMSGKEMALGMVGRRWRRIQVWEGQRGDVSGFDRE